MGFYQRKTLQTSTRCGQAATAWPSVMALLVFHSDTTAGSTRLLDSQGDQNIEYGTAVASLAPSTAAERLPPSPPPFSLACKEKRKKKEERPPIPPHDNKIPGVQRPLIHLQRRDLGSIVSDASAHFTNTRMCLSVPSPCAHTLLNMHAFATEL